MAEVVSPRGVTYRVTCHQWLRKGESSIRTLPTICVHRCRVWQVSRHSSYGSAGQSAALALSLVFCAAFMLLSIWFSSLSFDRLSLFLQFLRQQGISPGRNHLLTLTRQLGLARLVVELRGDQHHGEQDEPKGDEVGEPVARGKRTGLRGTGRGERGQQGQSNRCANLLAGGQQAPGQALLAPVDARRRPNGGGRQGQGDT